MVPVAAPNGPGMDAIIHAIAAEGHGVVRRSQLLEAGIPAYAIDNRVRNGRLVRLHRGVYRAGFCAAPLEAEMAAVAACGDGSFLSHHSAAVQWSLLPADARPAQVEVSVRRHRHPEPGPAVRVYRVAGLGPDETTTLRGIPATAPARTVVDLAQTLGPQSLELVMARAERMRLARPEDVARLVQRYPGRPGTKLLGEILALDGGPALTRSPPEALLLGMIRRARLPTPEANRRLHGYELDFVWRAHELVVEVDGYTTHSSRRMLRHDRRKDRALKAAGFDVLRFTVDDLTEEPEVVLRDIVLALARGEP